MHCSDLDEGADDGFYASPADEYDYLYYDEHEDEMREMQYERAEGYDV